MVAMIKIKALGCNCLVSGRPGIQQRGSEKSGEGEEDIETEKKATRKAERQGPPATTGARREAASGSSQRLQEDPASPTPGLGLQPPLVFGPSVWSRVLAALEHSYRRLN